MKTKRITGRKLQTIRRDVLTSNPLCVSCQKIGRVRLATEVDHIVPLHKGGSETPSNRQPLCKDCHKEKTELDVGARLTSGSDVNGMPTRPGHHWAGSP